MPLLQTTTAEGALKGMILARAPHELGEQEAAYLQDAIVNQPGFVNRRGAITGTTAITAANLDSARPVSVATVTDPSGVQKIGFFYIKDTGAAYELWVSVYTPALVFIQKHFMCFLGGTYPGRKWFIQTTPSIDGSIVVSCRQSYGRDTLAAFSHTLKWYGGCPTTSIPNAYPLANITATEGSTAVTGGAAEIAKISFPGTVLASIGVVASVFSATQVNLVYPSTITAAGNDTYFAGELLGVMRGRGKISCSAGVLTGITGYGTRFTSALDVGGTGSGFLIIDADSMKVLATRDIVGTPYQSDTLTATPSTVPRSAALLSYYLTSSNAVGEYWFHRFSPPSGGGLAQNSPASAKGSFWCSYKGYMVSLNAVVNNQSGLYSGDLATNSRAYIHGPRFPEIMDHSAADGDWFEVPSSKVGDPNGICVVSGLDSVVLCKAQESYALTGNSPDDFTIGKIADDGALGFESGASWRGAPIWLGKTGIWMFDGVAAKNIVADTLGNRWIELVASFDKDSTTQDSTNYFLNQARCFVYKDYLFVNVTNTGSQHSIYTDGVARTSNTLQLMIYLPTMAVSYLTNFNFQCHFVIGTTGYVVLPQSASTTHHIFPLDNLFVQGGAISDTILTANSYDSGTLSTSVGPWFHMESRKFDGGDGLWKKTWKQLAIEFNETDTKRMYLETVAGLNTTGLRAALPYTGTGLWKAARVKFRTRDQYMSFRLYEDISNRPSTLKLGAWQWGYKFARRGAV